MTFTSDLTIDEILLVEQAGFEPVELVMGASYFHVGYQSLIWKQNEELLPLSRVMYEARHQAMTALDQQTRAARADGVVAVRLEVELSGHEAEFVAIGTAVRRRDGQGAAFHTAAGAPFTCSLSGEDFWALIHAGMRPVSLAMGVCVYHVANQSIAQWFRQVASNVEHEGFTQGLYTARETAMERMQAEAQAAGATGVLDVQVTEQGWSWHSHVMELLAVGTAVAPMPQGFAAEPTQVQPVVMVR